MANYSTLKAAVADVVKTNGTRAITGANLQSVLLSIINSIGGGGYIFKGVATPSTNAGTPDQNVFYVGGAGTFANMGTSTTVPVGSIGIFKYNGSWTSSQIKIFDGCDDEVISSSPYAPNGNAVTNAVAKKSKTTFIDKKKTTSPLSHFKVRLINGCYYAVKSSMTIGCSFGLFDKDKNLVRTISSGILNSTIIFKCIDSNIEYIGGYVNALEYRIDFEELYYNNDDISYNLYNGYIHTNASAGIFSSDIHYYTDPLPLKQGCKVRLQTADSSASYTAIASLSSKGVFTAIKRANDYSYIENGNRIFEWIAPSDMVVVISALKENFELQVKINQYITANDLNAKFSEVAVGNWKFPFKVIKGNRYLVKNLESVNTSFYTLPELSSVAPDDDIDIVKSEQTTDQVIPSVLLGNSWSIFVASGDANCIAGYNSSHTTISIEDITNKKLLHSGLCPNTVFQSREGRVSSVYYPNQTKWGVEETAKNQYDRIRFTVRKTADSQPVYFLCHNATINALARNMDGTVISEDVSSEGKTLAELNAYDWGIIYGKKFQGMNVPLLDDTLKYASLYNLSVTLEFNSTMLETDCRAIFELCSRYGVVDNLILISNFTVYNYFRQYSNKISYFWGGTYEEFQSALNTIKTYKTELNDVYICCYPFGSYPSDEYLTAIYENDFIPYHSSSFNISAFNATLGKGIGLIECANVPFIKEEAYKYADEVLNSN